MVKVTAPLHSIAVSGSIGGIITFRQTAGGSVATVKPRPYPQKSSPMLENQQSMRDARTAYLALSTADRALWQELAVARSKPAWCLFFMEYKIQVIAPPDAPLIPEPYL